MFPALCSLPTKRLDRENYEVAAARSREGGNNCTSNELGVLLRSWPLAGLETKDLMVLGVET